jgi:hypothetical protein
MFFFALIAFGFLAMVKQRSNRDYADLQVIAISLFVLLLGYIFCTIFFCRKKYLLKKGVFTFDMRFLVNGVFSSFLTVLFLLFSFLPIALAVHEFGIWAPPYYLAFLLFIALVQLVLFYTMILNIRKGKFIGSSKGGTSGIVAFAASGAIVGTCAAKVFSQGIDQQTAYTIVVACFLLVSALSSFGSVHFLKHYYVKKYDITLEENEAKAGQDMEEAAAKKR